MPSDDIMKQEIVSGERFWFSELFSFSELVVRTFLHLPRTRTRKDVTRKNVSSGAAAFECSPGYFSVLLPRTAPTREK